MNLSLLASLRETEPPEETPLPVEDGLYNPAGEFEG